MMIFVTFEIGLMASSWTISFKFPSFNHLYFGHLNTFFLLVSMSEIKCKDFLTTDTSHGE